MRIFALQRLIAFALQASTKSSTPGKDPCPACMPPKAACASASNIVSNADYSGKTFILRRNHSTYTPVHARATALPACVGATLFANGHALPADIQELHICN